MVSFDETVEGRELDKHGGFRMFRKPWIERRQELSDGHLFSSEAKIVSELSLSFSIEKFHNFHVTEASLSEANGSEALLGLRSVLNAARRLTQSAALIIQLLIWPLKQFTASGDEFIVNRMV